MMLGDEESSPECAWYREAFGADKVVAAKSTPQQDGYRVSGLLGAWFTNQIKSRRYRFAVAEFGTHPVVRVLASLRADNRAHFFGSPDSPQTRQVKSELVECFCPASTAWREKVVRQGLRILEQSVAALDKPF